MKKLFLLPLLFIFIVLSGCSNNLGARTNDDWNKTNGILYPKSADYGVMVGSNNSSTTADLFVDSSKGLTYFNSNALFGSYILGKDNLVQTILNLPSSGADNTPVSGAFSVGGSPVFTIYGQANGSGGADNLRVGIGTTTPRNTFEVDGESLLSSTTISILTVSNGWTGTCPSGSSTIIVAGVVTNCKD